MGHVTSIHESKGEEEKTETRSVSVRGLHNGNVVRVKGETYAGVKKYFDINFFNGDDIVLHFKVLLLRTENNFNALKMNHRTRGRWGPEEYKDNLIYVNHHFELQFTCLQDKFSMDVDGKHWCCFKHRVSPDKINYIALDGDVVWKDITVSNQAQQYSSNEEDVKNSQMPTPEEVKKFVQSLAARQTLELDSAPGADSTEDVEKLSGLMTDGLEITKKLLGEKKGSFIKNVMKYGGYLSKAFSAGCAVYKFIKFVSTIGEPSDMDRIMQKLGAISEQLKELEATIEQGFAEVIEHMDLVEFRNEVKIPVRTMYDLYIRCFTVRGSAPIEDFKKQCKEKKSPRDVFSAMYEFLDSKKNIFETHLKTKKYVYSVYDEWSDAFFNYATKLIIMNMFYYGILVEERKASENPHTLIHEKDEIEDLIKQIIRMDDRLKKIEEDRLRTFHSGGYGKEFLAEHFKKIKKHGEGDSKRRLPSEILPRIAYRIKNSWGNFNGPADIGKVTVLENIGKVTERGDDTVCIALIQPITKDIRKANEKAYTDLKDKVKEVVNNARDRSSILPAGTIAKIKESLPKISLKPLLVLYCTDFDYDREKKWEITLSPINYEMSSEAWSSPGGPFPLKNYWVSQADVGNQRREVQILFQ